MAKLPALSLFLLIFSSITVATFTLADVEVKSTHKTWCIAKPSTEEIALQANLDYACPVVDCGTFLQQGCPCYEPDNRVNRASVAMNVYYQRNGRNKWNCDFNNTGLITLTDPSYGGCVYE